LHTPLVIAFGPRNLEATNLRYLQGKRLARILLIFATAPGRVTGALQGEIEMRRFFLAVVGLFMLATASQAQAQTVNFTANLGGGDEVPKVNTGAAGTATVSVNLATRVVTYRIEVYNMPVGTTAAHFHVGDEDTAGPVVVNFTVATGISNDFAISGTASATDLTARAAQGINSWEDFIQALLLNNIYINVHSTANPGGEIRGQVIRVP